VSFLFPIFSVIAEYRSCTDVTLLVARATSQQIRKNKVDWVEELKKS
jgi:hypothetical protein